MNPAASPSDDDAPDAAANATLDTLEDALEALRERDPQIPEWEYFDGVLTALVCTRRAVGEAEWAEVLFGREGLAVFPTAAERTRFSMGWMAREAEVRAALSAPVEALDDPRALTPAAIDWRGLLATLDEDERAEAAAEGTPPALGSLWATGFLFVVEHWAAEWARPRDKEIAAMMDDALGAIADLTQDDRAQPALNLFDDDAAPSTSEARFEAFGEAIWAVYDLFDIAQSLGPRTAPARADPKVGRNDPCPCGSGQKYKKCCGA